MTTTSAQQTTDFPGRRVGWSWTERTVVALAWTAVLFGCASQIGWLAGGLALTACVVTQVVVGRHGGWHLLGPHFYYDVVRLARRGQSTRMRIAFLFTMFIGLIYVYETGPSINVMRPNDFARVSERFAFTLFLVQNLAVMVLTPAYLASGITQEKERRTLEMLFTTHLSNKEIVLGIYFARVIHLVGFVLAGFPILCFIQFWGGIDMLLLAGNLANTLLNILTIGSICLLTSAVLNTVSAAVTVAYVLILPIGTCCMFNLQGAPFVLYDARSGASNSLAVQDLGWLLIPHVIVTFVCLVLAVLLLRNRTPFAFAVMPPPPPRVRRPRRMDATPKRPADSAPTGLPGYPTQPTPVREETRFDALAIPYTLPPVSDNALLWKERFLGGPSMAFSPVLLVPMVPFFAAGVGVMVISILHAIFVDSREYQRAFDGWITVLNFFYYVFLGLYGLGVAFRAAGSVARERQQQTLEPLLLLPIERRELLVAKWLGSLWRGWSWLCLALADVMIGVLVGAYHPFSAVMLCLAPWPIFFFFASFGLLLSVTAQTVLRAYMIMGIVLLVFVSSVATSIFDRDLVGSMDPFVFSWWQSREMVTQRLLSAVAILGMYLVAGAVCWSIAVSVFERRGQRP